MLIKKLKVRMFRNRYNMKYSLAEKNRVTLEYSKTVNLGDSLSPLIVNAMLERKGLTPDRAVSRTKHLMAVGSIIGRGRFDVTVWGTGVLREGIADVIAKQRLYRRYDIRAVRGPRTRKMLLDAGYDCPERYGDPAILMPQIYPAADAKAAGKKYPVSLILHHRTELCWCDDAPDQAQFRFCAPEQYRDQLHIIDPNTTDYRDFLDQIVQSERVISASLHGIILAESYGVPAVFLHFGVQDQEIKFHDWYESTGRTLRCVKTLPEAMDAAAMPLPDLSGMQKQIADAFPYDLWDESLPAEPYRRANS